MNLNGGITDQPDSRGLRHLHLIVNLASLDPVFRVQVWLLRPGRKPSLEVERHAFGWAEKPVEAKWSVPEAELAHTWVVVDWLQPRHRAYRQGGLRVDVATWGEIEFWREYRWKFWPRRTTGRWARPVVKGPLSRTVDVSPRR